MDLDIQSAFIFGLVLVIPALVVFGILMAVRLRRGKFHRQRIARRSHRSTVQDEEPPKEAPKQPRK